MNLHNVVHDGYNPACVLIMPMLERKDNEWPRFRDCFITKDNNIGIYTRMGGPNRDCGFGEEELYKDPNFIRTYDDEADDTYATYEFSVPEKWRSDFDRIVTGKFTEVSDEYISYVKQYYPILAQEGMIDEFFKYDWKME